MKRNNIIFALLTICMLAVLPACGQSPAPSNTTPEQVLRVLADPNFYDASSLSPNIWGVSGISRLLWAPLIAHDPSYHVGANGLDPNGPVISNDGKTYTFHLRKDAQFSDGTPITAKDVAFDLQYDIMTGHPKIKGPHLLGNTAVRYYSNVVGASSVFAGSVPADEFNAAPVSGVQVLDDYTLQIQLVHSDPGFIYALMFDAPSGVKPADIQRGEGKSYTDAKYWTTEPGVAFSGPYELQSYTPNQGMVLVPNPHYYGAKPKLQTIKVTFAKDHETAISAFQNHEADWLDINLTFQDVQNAQTDPYLKGALVRSETNSVQQLYISAYPPMDDIHVRRALYMAIDRKALVNLLGSKEGQTFYSPIIAHVTNPAACPGIATTVKPIEYNPAAAQAELAQSKYGSALKNMLINIQLGLFGEDVASNKVEAQYLQQSFSSVLGLTNVQIQASPINDFSKPPYPTQLWPNEQGNTNPDLYGFLNNLAPDIAAQPIPSSGPASMFTLPYAPDVTALMKEAFAQPTLDQRCAVLGKVLQAWENDVVTMNLFTNAGYTMVAPWVKNLNTANGDGGLEYLYLNPGMESTYIAAH